MTIIALGHEWPVLKELSSGWHLCYCEGGPAIVNNFGDTEKGFVSTMAHANEELPERVRAEAIQAYHEMTWPLVKEAMLKRAKGER